MNEIDFLTCAKHLVDICGKPLFLRPGKLSQIEGNFSFLRCFFRKKADKIVNFNILF